MFYDFHSLDYGVHTIAEQIVEFDHNAAKCISRLNKFRSVINGSVKADRAQNATQVAIVAQGAADKHDHKQLFKCISDLVPKKCRKTQGIALESGEIASTPLETRMRWQRFLLKKSERT